jgi:hypothetical protein
MARAEANAITLDFSRSVGPRQNPRAVVNRTS